MSATCRGGRGVLAVASAQCMDLTPLELVESATTQSTIFKTEESLLLYLRLVRTYVYTYVYVNERNFVGSRGADDPAKHTTKTMSLFPQVYLCHSNPNPFVYQYLMSTYASTSYQPYDGN